MSGSSASGSDDGIYKCVECSEEFDDKPDLNSHLMTEHNWTEEEVKEGEKQYEVERVISHRWDKKEKEQMFLVKWVGFEEPSEIPMSSFDDGCTALKKYLKQNNVSEPKSKGSKSKKRESTKEDRSSCDSSKSSGDSSEEVVAYRQLWNIDDLSDDDEGPSSSKKRRLGSEEGEGGVEVEDPNAFYGTSMNKQGLKRFLVGRKAENVVGVSLKSTDCSPSSIFYLVQFSNKKGESKHDSALFLPADNVWKDHPKLLRKFFEERVIEQCPTDLKENGTESA